jgi:hypothetical protein
MVPFISTDILDGFGDGLDTIMILIRPGMPWIMAINIFVRNDRRKIHDIRLRNSCKLFHSLF